MRDIIALWMSRARKGESFVYHIGLLCLDRGCEDTGVKRTEKQKLIHEGGCSAWRLYEQGRVTLVQRKQAVGVYQYIMVRR